MNTDKHRAAKPCLAVYLKDHSRGISTEKSGKRLVQSLQRSRGFELLNGSLFAKRHQCHQLGVFIG